MLLSEELGKYPERVKLIIEWILSKNVLLETIIKGSITFNFNGDSIIPEIKIVDAKINRKDAESPK